MEQDRTELHLGQVDDLQARWERLAQATRPEAADQAIATAVGDARTNLRKISPHAVLTAAVEGQIVEGEATAYDHALLAEGDQLDKETAALGQRLEQAIAAAGELPSPAAEYGTGTTNYLMAQTLDELQRMRVRSEITASGATIAAILRAYEKSDDTRDSTFVRIIEDAHAKGMLATLGVRVDDSIEATMAHSRLSKVVSERRMARVPAWMFQARDRLRTLKTLPVDNALRLLRDGRGIARRPRVA